jgi:RNA polymerase sigma factor (sigma-70 family)
LLQGGAQFTTTHWSVVVAAGNTAAPGAAEALETLCRAYWKAVYAYIRHRGHDPEDALDLTQAFFARFLERKQVKLADPDRGRFRSFLIASLKHFIINEWRKGHAAKRGGDCRIVSLQEQREAETHFLIEPADPAAAPDLVYEKRWAHALLNHALERLSEEYASAGKQEHFNLLKTFVWGDAEGLSLARIGAKLGLNENATGAAVHRLKRRYGELLREEVGRTVAVKSDIDEELRHLLEVIRT